MMVEYIRVQKVVVIAIPVHWLTPCIWCSDTVAEANPPSWLMRDDPARLTSCTRGYFTVRHVTVRVAQAFELLLNPIWDWEQ
jgi:hypothetical protein